MPTEKILGSTRNKQIYIGRKSYVQSSFSTILRLHEHFTNIRAFLFAAMLLYRISRCCRHIFVKLFHTIFHILAIPCIALGFFAVFDSKNLQGHNHFYSLHSWMGLVTMGMFALQVRSWSETTSICDVFHSYAEKYVFFCTVICNLQSQYRFHVTRLHKHQ